jgi:nicotinamidase/pyrazinamidase
MGDPDGPDQTDEERRMKSDEALLIVDVQNDFCPEGSLPVPEGDKVVPVLNEYIEYFAHSGSAIVASRDWHPERTSHFKSYGGRWPAHCIQGTNGAEFHPQLKLPAQAIILSKGMNPQEDSYSAFQGVDKNGTDLNSLLRARGLTDLYVGGLATDYCVRHTVLDALFHGYKVCLLMDAIRGVDVEAGDSERAIDETQRAGARMFRLENLYIL